MDINFKITDNFGNSNRKPSILKRNTNKFNLENENNELLPSLYDNKKTKISPQYEQKLHDTHTSPESRKLFFAPQTPFEKNRRSVTLSGFEIKNEETQLKFDASKHYKELEAMKQRKIEILKQVGTYVNYSESCICIHNLQPDIPDPVEKYIFNYPSFFETNTMYSKFTSHCQITTSKLSEIHLCRHRFNGQYYIIKSGHKPIGGYALSDTSLEVINEVKILSLIGKHSHIVDYFDSWIEDGRFHTQIEFISGGTLRDFLIGNVDGLNIARDTIDIKRRFTISDGTAYVLLAQLSSVLAYLHEKLQIFHGDLKPSNILVDLTKYFAIDKSKYSLEKLVFIKKKCQEALIDPKPNPKLIFKLCDFGRSGYPMYLGTMEEGDGRYLPSLNDTSDDNYLIATGRDVYSFGMTIYECLGGKVNQHSVVDIRKGESIPWPSTISLEWREIIKSMIIVNAKERITARQLLKLEKVKPLVLPECLSLLNSDIGTPHLTNSMDTN